MAQILNISISKRLPPITILTAGDTQQVVCTPMVYLSAIVDGDLVGHTTLWEQVEGVPTVDLQVVSETNAFYAVSGSPGNDKVFRFWVDKGRSYQKFKDVIVRTTPGDIVANITRGYALSIDTPLDGVFKVTGYNLTADFTFDSTIPFNSAGQSFSDGFYLGWDRPTVFLDINPNSERLQYQTHFLGTRLESFNGTNWTELTTVNGSDLRQYPLGNADKIRIGALYNLNGQTRSVYNDWFHVDGNATKVIIGKTVITPNNVSVISNDVVLTRLVYSLNIVTFDESIDAATGALLSNDVAVTRLVYVIDSKIYDDTAVATTGGALSVNYSITRVTSGTIGG